MPVPFLVDVPDRGHLLEQLTGLGDGKRSTKTQLKSHEVAMLLSLVRSDAEDIAHTLQELHFVETGDFLEGEDLRDAYSEIREWENLHQLLVEHFASVEGFMVRSITGMMDSDDEAPEARRESSAEVSGGKRWMS